MMSCRSRAWLVAASIGTIEALKDQAGFCRWNYAMRLLHQHAKNNLRSYTTQSKKLSSTLISNKMREDDDKLKQSEESLRKVIKGGNHGCSLPYIHKPWVYTPSKLATKAIGFYIQQNLWLFPIPHRLNRS
ncbi:hypothetical protein ACJIZ3_012665 [Penstemon smallii]|uniref:Wound-responsive family protein n=1 Tax=Penstemon smallii TaxID=265156 RepID=A0ABD3UQY3_9LAMI